MPRRSLKYSYSPMREAHVIQYLHMWGPVTFEELMKAIPGNVGGRADRVARNLISEGRLEARFIKDYE